MSEGRSWLLDERAVLDALPRAVIVTGGDGRIVSWNQRATEIYGWQANEVLGRSASELLVPMSERDRAELILDVVRTEKMWEGDFTVLRRDGQPVRVWVSDRPVVDEAGEVVAIVGASEDVTEQRLMAQQAADLTERLRLALDAGQLGTFRWDLATGVTEWDTRLEALFGLEPGAFAGTFDAWVALLHPDDAVEVIRTVDDAVRTKGRYLVEHRVVWPDGSIHWLHGAGQVTLDPAGNVTGTIGCTQDVTDAKQAEQELGRLTIEAVEAAEAERVSRERLEFLSDINDALAVASDRADIMARVARAAVPRLGDWCSIYVLPHPDARIPDVETAHLDPAMVSRARELQQQFPYDPDAAEGMPRVIRTGESQFYPDVDETVLRDLDASDEQRDVVRDLALRSSIAVPLVKQGRVLGGMQLVMTESRRRYTGDDLTLAEAVAARIAASLENHRLTEEQRQIAATLQASLLPTGCRSFPASTWRCATGPPAQASTSAATSTTCSRPRRESGRS